MVRVTIVGASGYVGGELLRLLLHHPEVTVTAVAAGEAEGKRVGEVFPSLSTRVSLTYEPLDCGSLSARADFVFCSLPHRSSMEPVAQFLSHGKKVVDLSADYRLKSAEAYEKWYQTSHIHPELLKAAVYGLPELHREEIKKASLVGNPGCYPTAIILAIAPLISTGRLSPGLPIIADAKSGLSGAGRTPALPYHLPEAEGGIVAYQVGVHRHLPEIHQELAFLAGRDLPLVFTPHLVPMSRGLLSTTYLSLKEPMDTQGLGRLYQDFYKGHPFVRIVPEGTSPNPKYLHGSNFCDIGLFLSASGGATQRHVVAVSALDNLVKGAAGQAVQCMNLMLGYDETLGLDLPGVFP